MNKNGRRAQSGVITIVILLLLVIGAVWFVNNVMNQQPLPTKEGFMVNQYTGTWYAMYHIPQKYEENCECTEALYQQTTDDSIIVTNRCTLTTTNETQTITGEARPQVPGDYTRLDVRFPGTISEFIPGDYYVIDTANDYEWAVVGSPDRDSLWILDRDRNMSEELYSDIIIYVDSLGFNINDIEPINQASCS